MYITPQPLKSRVQPFDHADWIFELKYDGFRALAHIRNGQCQLVSRNGTAFASFSHLNADIGASIQTDAVVDGEIVCLDSAGHPQFRDLLFHRGNPCFFAFDLLSLEGRDLRLNALIERKGELRRILSKAPANSRIRYADHIERQGSALFERVCQLDLEGVVAKLKHGQYVEEREYSTWLKIKNREYSQAVGREELFERDRHAEPVPGWHSCAVACARLETT
jgi:bifunctional non-homologous end joining protein LigD